MSKNTQGARNRFDCLFQHFSHICKAVSESKPHVLDTLKEALNLWVKRFWIPSLFAEKKGGRNQNALETIFRDVPKISKVSNYFVRNKIYINRKLVLMATSF